MSHLSLRLLRQAVQSKADEPGLVLNALKDGWNGSLGSKDYCEVVLYLVTLKTPHVKQLRMLGALGADFSKLAPLTYYEDKLGGQSVRPWISQNEQRYKFMMQLLSRPEGNYSSSAERVTWKGMVISHLEDRPELASYLPSMKRSLILDARAMSGLDRIDPQHLEEALGKLQPDDRTSFIWCSITRTSEENADTHHFDTVVRKLKSGEFEYTTCNRGEGAVMIDKAKYLAGALSSRWQHKETLAREWSVWTEAMSGSMESYLNAMHAGKEMNADYRSQKTQTVQNCGTKSMFAALNLILGAENRTLYRSIKDSLKQWLLTYIPPPPAPPPQIVNFADQAKAYRRKRSPTPVDNDAFLKMLGEKLPQPNFVPDKATLEELGFIMGSTTHPQEVRQVLTDRWSKWKEQVD